MQPTRLSKSARQLDAAAVKCREVASAWVERLDDGDRAELVTAFHRAEALARSALEQAIEQVGEEYRAELTEQLEDEDRHVDVFARWQENPAEISPPRVRTRPCSVWLVMLLANELTGFCQFHMLLALLRDPEREAEVEAILADERRHIERLHRWLLPVWPTLEAKVMHDFLGRFRKDLPGRMGQFFPRPELEGLRLEMAGICDELLADLR